MGTPLQSVGDKVNGRKGNQAKDALPRTHPDRHRRLRLDPDEGLEGRLALGQPGMPVQLPHLCRLAGPGARQLPLSGLYRSSLVLRRPPPLILPGPLPLRKVPGQPVVIRSLLHPSRELRPPPPCPACLHRPCPPPACLHRSSSPTRPNLHCPSSPSPSLHCSCPPRPRPPRASPPRPSPPRSCLHPPRPPAQPHPQRLHRSTPGCRSVCLQECSLWGNEDFLLIYALFLN